MTNAVFGALRYLPPSGALLSFVERVVGPGRAATDADHFDMSFWPHLCSTRTGKGIVEPDVLIDTGTALICVEAKYKAGFGRYTREGGGTWHQLAVQAEALVKRARELGRRQIVLVAVTHAAHAPDDDLQLARQQMHELGLAPDDVTLTWLGWHHLAGILAALDDLRPHEATLRADTLEYLSWRKVTIVYEPVSAADWTSLGAAADAASARVFPAISAFASNLAGLLAPDIRWGPAQKGVYLSTTTALDKAPEWFPGRVCLSWWPLAFGDPSKRLVVSGFYPGLYTCFDFPAGRLEVGFAVSSSTAAMTQSRWAGQADVLAGELSNRPIEGGRVTLARSILSRTSTAIAAQDVTGAWLTSGLLNGPTTLTVHRQLPLDATLLDAQAALLQLTEAVLDRMPQVLGLTSISQTTARVPGARTNSGAGPLPA